MSQFDDNQGRRPDQGGDGEGGRPPSPPVSRGTLSWLVLISVGVLLVFLMTNAQNQASEVSPDEFVKLAADKAFAEKVTVESDRMWGKLQKDYPWEATKPRRVAAKISSDTRVHFIERLEEVKQEYSIEPGSSVFWPILLTSYGPILLVALLIYFFLFRSIRGGAGGPGGMLGNFGRSRHRVMNKEHSNVRLADVAGVDEAKDEVAEIIEFLKNPKRFQRLGGRVPRGVLLIGSPGCGKTLLARAIAGEADVPFFSISGSDFVEMFVGVGASRVRDLFKQAKDNSPCIIFLDEIDAVGRRRGSGFASGGHDEREQTLNAILVEMDGFDTSDQVIVMAATNRADVLDPALTRPGRFDRQIQVPLPDLKGRLEILRVHLRKIKLGPDVDIEKVARGTPMFSGADLAAIVNEAAILATLQNKDFVEHTDLEEARDKVRFGRAMKSRRIEEKERVATAYHEAGHAVLQCLLPDADPLHKVTIIPRGQALGATFSLPEKDRYGYGRKHLHATMRVLCGGRIAEERHTQDITSGAAMDIRMATAYARHMILEWGMSEKLGFVDYSLDENVNSLMPEKVYSEDTARVIDLEVKRLIDESYAEARRLIDENWEKVVALAEALLKHETLTSDDVARLMRGERMDKPTVRDLLDAERQPPRTPARPSAGDNVGPTLGDAPGPMPTPA